MGAAAEAPPEGRAAPGGAAGAESPLDRVAAHAATPWAILALAAALRLLGLGKGIWLDEAFTLEWSSGGSAGSVLDRLRGGDNAPLYFLLNHSLARLEPATRFLRLLPVACGVALVALVQRWARPHGPLAAALAGLLAATLPILLRTGDELRPYGLLVLASTAALVAADRAGRAVGGAASLTYPTIAAALAVTVASHHLGALLVVPLALVAVARPAADRPRAALFALALAAGVAVVLVTRPWQGAAAGSVAGDWWMAMPTPEIVATVLRTIAAPASPAWSEVASPSSTSRALVAAAAALAAVALAAGRRRAALPAIAALGWLAALLAASFLRLPVFWTRTILPAVPPLAVAVAIGAATARPRLRAPLALGIVLLSIAFAARWSFDEARRPLEPWDALTAEIRPRGESDVLLVHPGYALSPLAHYLGERRPQRVLQLGHRDPAAAGRVAETLARRRGRGPATVWIVLRIDVSTLRQGSALPRILDAVARERGRRAVRVLALTAVDAPLVPELLPHRRETLALVVAKLGRPAAVEERGWIVDLRFPPPPPAARVGSGP